MKKLLGMVMVSLVLHAEEVAFTSLPEPVQRIINENLDGGVVHRLERARGDDLGGYQALIHRDAGDEYLVLSAEGQVVRRSPKSLLAETHSLHP
ncbi:MAG TPA: hypothetical protein VGR78_02000 [Verrucomicrobiae bacterium]|nr:hypothetical protein [Verrucomicrobiae bacterium]